MTAPSARRAGGRSLVASALCAAAGVAAFQAGRRVLRPAGWAPAGWLHWWESAGPLVAVFALARLVVIAAAGLMALAFLAVAIDLLRRPNTASGRRAPVTSRILRGPALLRVVIGLSASGGALAACGPGPASPDGVRPVPPTLTNLEPAPAVQESPRATPATPPVAGTPAAPPAASPPAVSPPRPAAPLPLPLPVPGSWRVRPGDSLWSIAQATVGSPPERVAQYWAQLVQMNRDRLPDPSDPDLIFPGDVVQLPPRRAAGP